ncbi:peptide/nickel transport system substrate-binding protein [Humitalea rosea]|uniref:Peptide/nickel transport system substrate-binding protein n=1 Tax=Humitalea rosea TaxID=990373 RepID=A0A2W7J9X9_9PROT|nr:peptide ABC transporter substrate-binding protein [Humitalea rosea]PZW48782.1 peptide/nickel transport system substrate-binding protein [Humitalea rosea]
MSRLRRLCLTGAVLLAAASAQAQTHPQLTIGITQYPSTLHPNIDQMAAKSYVLGFTRRPLTTYDADWRLVCLLCETLPSLENGLAVRETTPDGKAGLALTIRLRADARWGDGTPVSSEDLRFAWEAGRAFETGFGSAEFYRSAFALDVVDDRSITLHFDRVTFDYASLGDFQPLPARIERPRWEADRARYRSRTGYDTEPTNPGLWSGPYRVASVTPGAAVGLLRNDAWAGPRPAFDRILIRTIESTPSLEAQAMTGQVDMIAGELGLPLDQGIALARRAASRLRLHVQPGLVYEHIDLKLDNPILADARVRRALLLASDRATIAARLYDGRQPVANGPIHPLDAGYDVSLAPAPYDPAGAARLLDAAGWSVRGEDGIRRNAAGERLSLEFMTTAGNRGREQVEQVLQGQWRQSGIEARIRNEPPRVFFGETLSHRRFDGLALFAWISAPENVPRGIFHSDEIPDAARNWSGQNYPGFRNAEMDRLLEDLPVTLEATARLPMWHRLQAILAEHLPVLPLWHRADAHLWPLWLDGVRPTGHLAPSSLWVEQWRVR